MDLSISKHNSKLGKITSFSIVAGDTCPGKTTLCTKACYVTGYYKQYPPVRKAYDGNLDLVLTTDWKVDIIRELSKTRRKVFRIHVSGDFFSPKYILEWIFIIAMFPHIRFLAYTRSWRVPRLRQELRKLRELPNVSLFASCDAEAYEAPLGWRKAWMGKPIGQVGKTTIMCPGYGPKELTCDKCLMCFKASSPDVWFPIH